MQAGRRFIVEAHLWVEVTWVPAFAGMTILVSEALSIGVTPAEAGAQDTVLRGCGAFD